MEHPALGKLLGDWTFCPWSRLRLAAQAQPRERGGQQVVDDQPRTADRGRARLALRLEPLDRGHDGLPPLRCAQHFAPPIR